MTGVTQMWLNELTAKMEGVHDEGSRGDFILRVHSAVINLKSDNLGDLMRLLLDSGAWRSYTYPSGDHYEFRAREFDYFLAQFDVDPRLVADAARHLRDSELRVQLVEASLPEEGEDRRSVEEIVAAYPQLGTWLDKYGLRALGPKDLYTPATRRQVKNGKAMYADRWRFVAQITGVEASDEQKAQEIVRRLEQAGLLDAVVELLKAETPTRLPSVTQSVTLGLVCSVCGATIQRGQTCSAACRNKAARARRKAASA